MQLHVAITLVFSASSHIIATYMFSVVCLKIALEFHCIIFSLRMGRFAIFSSANVGIATN